MIAQWPAEESWWYPAVIVAADGGTFEVVYEDGDRSPLTAAQLRPFSMSVGQRVYGNWRGGGSYYPGRISEVVGEAIHIQYDDGDREWSTPRMVRIHEHDLS